MGTRHSKTGVSSNGNNNNNNNNPSMTKLTKRLRFRRHDDGGASSSQIHHHEKQASHTSWFSASIDSSRNADLSNETYRWKEEAERLRQQHALLKRIWGVNFSAPVNGLTKGAAAISGMKVLDVGCGTGTWVIEMAKDFPTVAFTGVDVASVFPSPTGKKPANARFLQCDILGGLPFASCTFDFVYMRQLSLQFTERNLEKVIQELVRVLKPGGWVELAEVDHELLNRGPVAERLIDGLTSCLQSNERITSVSTYLPKCMESTGQLINMERKEKTCFLGKWSGKVGQLALEDLTKGWKSARVPVATKLGIPVSEYDELVHEFSHEVEQSKTLLKTWRFYGQKRHNDKQG